MPSRPPPFNVMPARNVRATLIDKLNDSSMPYRDPLEKLDWNAVDTDSWWLPPHALSLAGTNEFEALAAATRRRLSHYEFVHLLEVGLWLEGLFMQSLGTAQLASDDSRLRRRFLHEIREEAGHSLMFLELIDRSGVRIENAARHRPRLASVLSRLLGAASPLFWSLVVIGEELSDKLNRLVRHGIEEATISSLVYHLSTLHVVDEARHIAHARAMCAETTSVMPVWRRHALSPALALAFREFVRHLYYPRVCVYAAAGLPQPNTWRARALASPRRRLWVADAISPTLDFLRAQGWRIGL